MIAIVGGGISGLAVGHYLAAAGEDFVVLEAAERAGGVIGSIEVEGRVLELGPQRTRITPPFGRLVDQLGLADRLVVAPDLPLYILAAGRLRRVPLSLAEALRTDLIGWPDRLRALLEPFTAGLREDETAARFFRRKFGARIYDRVIAPLYGGLYASDPDDMPARHALAATLETLGVGRSVLFALLRGARRRGESPACSFDRGLQVLTDAMALRLGDRVRTGSPVHAIRRAAGGYRLVTPGDEVRADRVVLACPAAAAAGVLAEVAPEAAERLARLRYNPLAVVHLLTEERLMGLGYQVAFDQGLTTRGVTWNQAMFGARAGRDGVCTAFLGGSAAPDAPRRGDRELGDLAAAEFREVIGAPARALHVHRTAMPAWDRSWSALEGIELPPGMAVCTSWSARPGLTGRLVDAARTARALLRPEPGT